MDLLTDTELIAQYKLSSDKEIVGILYKRYTHLVFGVCCKYLKDRDEAKDAVMTIFEKLMTDLLKHEIENFKSWLHSVSRNHCLMHLRKHGKQYMQAIEPSNEAEVMEYEQALHPSGENKEEMLQLMEKGIQTLKEEHRICLDLFYLKNKSYKEICDETGFELLQVKSFIQNGKRNLKIYMDKHLQHE